MTAEFESEPLVDTKTAARYLGFSEVQVRRMAKAGMIPCVPFKADKRTVYKFRISALQAHTQAVYLSNGVVNAAGVISAG